ncbi:hypothetical protein HPP92_026009 [Vanilla planifolia]|uniref:UspA domain-containing protein n=1 Tax=Vanilla planifolia TaxID=51239 RepID=A0A835PJ33_VANPL|nr:hypothetical protein HPP92_026009 [Vanilla planifolia]
MKPRGPHGRSKKLKATPGAAKETAKVTSLPTAATATDTAGMDPSSRVGSVLFTAKRRVMVVADPGRESASALQWALSHAILEHDELILLHAEEAHSSGSRRGGAFSALLRRPVSIGPGIGGWSAFVGSNHHSALSLISSVSLSSGSTAGGDYDFLEAMRLACEAAHPRVRVQIERVEMEGGDKAQTILSQTKMLGIDLLVIGQRRPPSSFLGYDLSLSLPN